MKTAKRLDAKGMDWAFALRFWSRFKHDGGHLVWTGSTNPKGYGTVAVGGRTQLVHRVAWVLKHGPIPNRRTVLHKPPCVTRACVLHLYLGTQQRNVADMMNAGRALKARGERQWKARLTDDGVREIRRRFAAGESSTGLSRELGVGENTILHVVHRRTWKHVS